MAARLRGRVTATKPLSPLARIRAEGGAEAVRSAILGVVALHGYSTAAAEALGTSLDALRSAARRVGVAWPARGAGRQRRTVAGE